MPFVNTYVCSIPSINNNKKDAGITCVSKTRVEFKRRNISIRFNAFGIPKCTELPIDLKTPLCINKPMCFLKEAGQGTQETGQC